MIHYNILEQLENDTSAERLANAVKENGDTIAKACKLIEDQQAEIEGLKYTNLHLRKTIIELRQALSEATGAEEPFRNEDYPGE